MYAPIFVPINGVVSCLRTHTVEELTEMTQNLSGQPYHWDIGEEPVSGALAPITYLIGYPSDSAE